MLAVFITHLSAVKTVFAEETAADLYQQLCASCHGADRLGAIGSALLPDNLKRLRKNKAVELIS